MVSEPVRSALRLALVALCGGAAVGAAEHGLYATALVGALTALWAGAVVWSEAERHRRLPAVPVSAPPPASVDARERRRLIAYLDLSPAPLVTLDGGGRLHAVNRAARRLFAADDRVPTPPQALLDALAIAVPGRAASLQIAGRAFAIAVTDLALAGAETRIAALLDIEAEMRAAEAQALREVLRVLQHELVNTLTPIASLGHTAVELLDSPSPDLAEVRDAVGTVARRAEGLRRLAANYAELARLPEPTPSAIDLAAFTGDYVRLFARRWPDFRLDLDLATAPRTLRGDPDQLGAALWALLQNAAEAVHDRLDGTVALAMRATAEGVTIAVADNGPGVAPQDRDRIFQPFFTTKRTGSGIGLALARQVLRAHGGELSLAEQEGSGAAFLALLPHRSP